MLLDELCKLSELGAKEPLFLWKEEFEKIAVVLTEELEVIFQKLPEGTTIKKHLEDLLSVLRNPQADEFELAQLFLHMTGVFKNQNSAGSEAKVIAQYVEHTKKFFARAQKADFHKRSREQLSKRLTPQKRTDFDKELFLHDGMMFVLEYDLALYKKIQDAKTESEKRMYIESSIVDLGFGDVPGLLADINSDDILDKFIYRILNEEYRTTLLRAYYQMRSVIIKISVHCNKQGTCRTEYQDVTTEQVVEAFRLFLQKLLEVYLSSGVEKLSSYFFTPYGEKPFIKEITL